MVPLAEMVAIAHDSTVAEAIALVARVGYSRLPVYEDRIDNVVGILHHLDLLTATDATDQVDRYMRRAYFTPETQEVDELLFILQREAASAAIIVDEFGGTVGLITLEDVVEEIVGEIHDEFDSTTGLWRSVEDGYVIDARAQIETLNESSGCLTHFADMDCSRLCSGRITSHSTGRGIVTLEEGDLDRAACERARSRNCTSIYWMRMDPETPETGDSQGEPGPCTIATLPFLWGWFVPWTPISTPSPMSRCRTVPF